MKNISIDQNLVKKLSLNPTWFDEIPFFSKEELPLLIEKANNNGLIFLGADGVFLSEGKIIPDLNWIIDSSLTSTLDERSLIIFLRRIKNFLKDAPNNILFECFFAYAK